MVIIERQQKRRVYWNAAINFVPDVVIAWVIAWYFFNGEAIPFHIVGPAGGLLSYLAEDIHLALEYAQCL